MVRSCLLLLFVAGRCKPKSEENRYFNGAAREDRTLDLTLTKGELYV